MIYSWAMELRNFFYDKGIKKIHRLERPVISIGNLTLGGTGKTPIGLELVRDLESKGFRCGIISRGYKGRYHGVQRVDPEFCEASSIYGDEPVWLAKKLKNSPIYVCRQRVLAGEVLLKNESVDFIIADDGFQHRSLHRDLDIVLIDMSQPFLTEKVLPFGRLREAQSNISRADYVILTKCNNIPETELKNIYDFLGSKNILKNRIIESSLTIESFRRVSTESSSAESEVKNFDIFSHQPYVLLSGLGNPSSFENLMRSLLTESTFIKHFCFKDHHHYTILELLDIVKWMNQASVPFLFMTEKDEVKITTLLKQVSPLELSRVKIFSAINTIKKTENWSSLIHVCAELAR